METPEVLPDTHKQTDTDKMGIIHASLRSTKHDKRKEKKKKKKLISSWPINQNKGKERGEQGSDSGVKGWTSGMSAGVDGVDVDRSSEWAWPWPWPRAGDTWKSLMVSSVL